MKQLEIEFRGRGWLVFKVENERGEIFRSYGSFLEDTPVKWLKGVLAAYEYEIPLVLTMDEEGTEVKIISDEDGTIFLTNRMNGIVQMNLENLSFKELSEFIMESFEDNFEYLVNFLPESDGYSEEERLARINLLTGLLNRCKLKISGNGSEGVQSF